MTRFILLPLLCLVLFSGFQCKKSEYLSGCVKGRLEIKGICMNYVIKVLDGGIDPALIESSWQDPSTGITHYNVFALGSPCSFPENIKEGDEFYFRVVTEDRNGCAVCQAYRPVPSKNLKIEVSGKTCP